MSFKLISFFTLIMTNNIRFKIIAGKINKIPEFYTIFARRMPNYINDNEVEARPRPNVLGRGRRRVQSFEAEAEAEARAKSLRTRPRPQIWPRGLNVTGVVCNDYA